MFQALLCPSSGARDYDVDYHIGLHPGHYSCLTAPNLQHTANGGGGGQFSQLLAAEVCASAVVMVVMLDTPCSE